MKLNSGLAALGLGVASLLLAAGCSQRLATITVMSTQNVSLSKIDLDSLPQQRGVVGEDARFWILFIPLGFPTVQGAADDALRKGNGDLIVDGSLYAHYWTAILFSRSWLEIRGTVIKTRKGPQ